MNLRIPRLVLTAVLATVTAAYFVAPAPAADESPKAKKADSKASGKFEVYKDKSGKYRWRLVSSNGQTIATPGQAFSDKRACTDNIESVRRAAANASVEEVADEAK